MLGILSRQIISFFLQISAQKFSKLEPSEPVQQLFSTQVSQGSGALEAPNIWSKMPFYVSIHLSIETGNLFSLAVGTNVNAFSKAFGEQ